MEDTNNKITEAAKKKQKSGEEKKMLEEEIEVLRSEEERLRSEGMTEKCWAKISLSDDARKKKEERSSELKKLN